MGHDDCAALCGEVRRARRATRTESFVGSSGGSPKKDAASTEPTVSDITEEPDELGEPAAAEPQAEEAAAGQA